MPGFLGTTASAVVVAPGLAVTNGHVVDSAIGPLVGSVRGRQIPIRVLARSDRVDIALLSVPVDLPAAMAPMAGVAPRAPVWAMGTTNGFSKPVAAGQVLRQDAWFCTNPEASGACRDTPGLMLEMPAGFGYSGGPVVSESGGVVGLMVGQYLSLHQPDGAAADAGNNHFFAYDWMTVREEVARLAGGSAEIANLPGGEVANPADDGGGV